MSNEKMSAGDVLVTLDRAAGCVNPMNSPQHAEWHAELVQARNAVADMIAERDGLRAARIAYASEFDPDAEGMPNVGSIHENIRKLKAERAALREDAERLNWIDATGFSDYRQWDAKTGLSGHCIVISEGGRNLGGGPNIPAGIRATIDAARANEST